MLETLGVVTTGMPEGRSRVWRLGCSPKAKAKEVWQQRVRGDFTASHGVDMRCTELVSRAQRSLETFCLPISFSLFF